MNRLVRLASFLFIVYVATATGNLLAQTAHYADPQHGEFLQDWLLLGPITTESVDELTDAEFESQLFDADLLKDDGSETTAAPKPDQSSTHGAWQAFASDDKAKRQSGSSGP